MIKCKVSEDIDFNFLDKRQVDIFCNIVEKIKVLKVCNFNNKICAFEVKQITSNDTYIVVDSIFDKNYKYFDFNIE